MKDKEGSVPVDEFTLHGITTIRPWGSYTVLEESEKYRIKKIVVQPGKRLSLQLHNKRNEHWVVIAGKAKVVLGKKEYDLICGQSIYVPKKVPHRLGNDSRTILEIIEVAQGSYVGEDDIVRLDDDFGRDGKNKK
jgi:mannose-1-phosphate guanylyltransferase/mannose-6-phosphate isomerase